MRYWHPFTEEAIEEVWLLFQFWLFNSTQEVQLIFFFSFVDIHNLRFAVFVVIIARFLVKILRELCIPGFWSFLIFVKIWYNMNNVMNS